MDFDQLKQAQGAMWGSGPFEEVEVDLADMHDRIVASIGPQPGKTWLDLDCGTGGVAGQAAAAGAKVTGVDLAPALIDTAQQRAVGEAFWNLMSRAFGPTKMLAESMDDEARGEFREAYIEFTERERDGDVIRQSRPYLLIRGQRR